jgi:5-methylcytosine-specific restriction enzyme subunit McrC
VNNHILFEFDCISRDGDGVGHELPVPAFNWLLGECLRRGESGETAWARPVQRNGRLTLQVCNYVGVIRTPQGVQLEILPKTGATDDAVTARRQLLAMLRCLQAFRHLRVAAAQLHAARMPLLDIFVAGFLESLAAVVRRGLRSDYVRCEDDLPYLRGRLCVAQQLRRHLTRPDRFHTAHDIFSVDRAENRLIVAALRAVRTLPLSAGNERLARELAFVFADIPASTDPATDFTRVRNDRAVVHYADALAWCRLVLSGRSPLSSSGKHTAVSLLYPMEALFEAYVAHHLAGCLADGHALARQQRRLLLARRDSSEGLEVQPDLLVHCDGNVRLLLDTKWKVQHGAAATPSADDVHQLHAYGHIYLRGCGDLALVYPRTSVFTAPANCFEFTATPQLRLWLLPFCLDTQRLILPADAPFAACFAPAAVQHGKVA